MGGDPNAQLNGGGTVPHKAPSSRCSVDGRGVADSGLERAEDVGCRRLLTTLWVEEA